MNRSQLQLLRVLFPATITGQLLATGLLFAVRPPPTDGGRPHGPVLGYVAGGLLLAAVAGFQVLRARLVVLMREDETASREALRAGQAPRGTFPLLLLPAVLFEAPGIVAALALFLHGPTWLLAIPAVCAAADLWAMPSAASLEQLLND